MLKRSTPPHRLKLKMKKDIRQKDAIKAFESFGFVVTKFAEHIKMKNGAGVMISVPSHRKLKGSTLSEICNRGGINKQEFFNKV